MPADAHTPPLSPAAVARGMRLSVWEGGCWALMVGCSETYFLADAVRLGASLLQQGLVITLPLFVGALGPLLVIAALRRVSHRKPVAVASVLVQTLTLAGLFVVDLSGELTPVLLIGGACLYQMAGQAAGTAWSSWYGDLVPREVRGRYFAGRTRLTTVLTCVSAVGAGLLLQALEPDPAASADALSSGQGFRVIFAVAVLFRLASAWLFVCSPEPRFRGLADRSEARRYLGSRRGQATRRLLLMGAVFHLGVYLAAPYFGPYMLQGLHFSYWEYTAAIVTAVSFKALWLPYFGRRIDASGPRSVCLWAARVIALLPLPWLFVSGLGGVMLAQALSGTFWAAYEVAFFTLALQSSTSGTRPFVFAAQNVVNGAAQLLGSLVAASLLRLPGWGLTQLFVVSLAARSLLALVMPWFVTEARVRRPVPALRVVGMRPHGGLVHRPVDVPADDDVRDEIRADTAVRLEP